MSVYVYSWMINADIAFRICGGFGCLSSLELLFI